MVWTKLGDTFADNMDADGISTHAFTLHVAAYIFCNRMGTDGFIPRHMTRRLFSAISDVDQSTKELLATDRWIEADRDGKPGYEIVGFLDDQDSADMVAHRQEQRKEATRRWRAKVQGYPEVSNGQSKINSDASRDQSPVIQKHHGDALPPRPAPSRPKEAGKGREGTTSAGSPGGSPLPTSPSGKETTNQAQGLIDIKTLMDMIEKDEGSVQAQVGRITYDIELGDRWYDHETDRAIPGSAGIWLSPDGLNIDTADYAAEAANRLNRTIKKRLYDQARDGRSLLGVDVEDYLSFGIRTKDAAYWLAKLEEILVTDEVQDLAQAVVEAGSIRIGPDVTYDGEPIEGRTVIYANVTAYGPNLHQDRKKALHGAIGQQVLALVGEQRYYRSHCDLHTVAVSIPNEDADFWFEKFQEAINTDQVRELAQEVFSMTTSLDTTPEASR
jgi:hypothetical protein